MTKVLYVNVDLNSDQVIFHNCPKGYRLVNEVDENFSVEYNRVTAKHLL
ncbi:hypothetical protein IMAU40088_01296 [Lactobacillus helveticus]|nr:hypothetical protein [Lactobacillus helveticus]